MAFTSGQLLEATAASTARGVTVSGDATMAAGGALTIANNAISNAKAADVATSTIKGRTTAGTGDPEDLTAAQARTVIGVETTVFRTTDRTVNNSDTLADDTVLKFTAEANSIYAVRLCLPVLNAWDSSFKFAFTGPAAPTFIMYCSQAMDGSSATFLQGTPSGTPSDTAARSFGESMSWGNNKLKSTGVFVYIDAIFNVTTGGEIMLQWAQNYATVIATTVKAGAYLKYQKVA